MKNNNSEYDNLNIISIGELISDNKIAIPPYQRPYRWSSKSCITLYNDIYDAMINNLNEYRLGNVIIHNDGKSKYIVDGQQRLTTLSIILYAIENLLNENNKFIKSKVINSFMNCKYNKISYSYIIENYSVIKNVLNDLKEKDEVMVNNLYCFISDKCKVLQIITKNQNEAFQFFDSQNSRGKSLMPHDILKAYHLRVIIENTKNQEYNDLKCIIEKWENMSSDELEDLFSNYLFPIIKWSNKENGLYFDNDDIDIFKGININFNSNYGFVKFEKKYNGNRSNSFQITRQFIAGEPFFEYINCYCDKKKFVEKNINTKLSYDSSLFNIGDGSGFKYVKRLLICICLLVYDRFDEKVLIENINKFYKWSYALKIGMKSVYKESINRYALGNHDKVQIVANDNKNLFNYIINSNDDKKLRNITLLQLKENKYNGNIDNDNILKSIIY